VLYIGGLGRSGSTILDMLLGDVEGVVNVGEVRHLWERGLRQNARCSCRATFAECAFWSAVGEHAFGGWASLDAAAMVAGARAVDRHRQLPALLARPARIRVELDRYTGVLARLFTAIHAVSGAELVIDSSKDPPHGFVLREVPDLDLRTVHLVRDSRGVAYSWTKVVERPDATDCDRMMTRMSPARTALMWMDANALLELLGRSMPTVRVRYEDMVDDPDLWLGRVLEGTSIDPAARNGSAVHHALGGNPIRFRPDRGPLRVDREWRQQLSPRARRTVTALTAPMLRRYGYALDGTT
jgi:hypothetical protein